MRHSLDAIHGARADYAAGTLSVDDICRKYGMNRGTFYYWLDGGPPSGELHLEPVPRRRGGVARKLGRRRPRGDRAAVVERMWRTAEAQVHDIERRLEADDLEPDEFERDARVLAVLVKTLRELCALDETKAGQAAKTETGGDDDEVPRDIDEFQRALARRMQAFIERRTDAGVSGD